MKTIHKWLISTFAQIMLFAEATSHDSKTNICESDAARYAILSVVKLSPLALLLDSLQLWWQDNAGFCFGLVAVLLINAGVGIAFHLRYKTFNFRSFFTRNSTMAGAVIITFVVLEIMRVTIGDNVAGDLFKVLIQVMSLMYPTSKIVKNIFILSRGKHPPEFIMRKFYNFEKNGDLKRLFSTEAEDLDDIEGFNEYKKKLINYEKDNNNKH